MNLEALSVALRLDSSNFRAGMARAQQNIAGLKTTLNDFGKKTADIGRNLTTRVTLPIVAGFGLAISEASDLGESLNKVNQVFGENGQVIEDWSKGSAKAFGLSQNEALGAAGTLGNLFKGVGIATDQLPEFSQNVVQAAADLGSFNNVDPTQVLEDMRSGLVGEAEPLRKYGILLNEATVSQKAMELGLVDANGEISEAAKVQARYALIMEQVGDAQGDFARTSEGLANRTRILKAQFKDLAAQFGTIMLPLATKLAAALGSLMERFSGLSTRTKTIILVIAGIAAALGPLLIIVGQVAIGLSALAPAFALLLGPVGLVILALGALAIAYRTNFLGFRDLVDGIAKKVFPVLEAFAQYIRIVVEDGDILNDWLTHLPKPIQVVAKYLARLINGFRKLAEAIKAGNWRKALAALGDLASAPAKAFGDFFKSIQTGFAPLDRVFRAFGLLVTDFGRLIQEVFQGDFAGALEVGRRLLGRLGDFFRAEFDLLLAYFGLLWDGIRAGFAAIDWGALFGAIVSALGTLGSALVSAGAELIGGLLSGARGFLTGTVLPWLAGIGLQALAAMPGWLGTLAAKGEELIRGLYNGVQSYWDYPVSTFFGDLAGKIRNLLPDMATTLLAKGMDLLRGLYDGLTRFFNNNIVPFFTNIGVAVLSLLPGDLGTILLEKGKAVLQGFWNGIKAIWTEIEAFFSGLADAITGLVDLGALQGVLDKIVGPIEDAAKKIAGFAGDIAGALFGGGDDDDKEAEGEDAKPDRGRAQAPNVQVPTFGFDTAGIDTMAAAIENRVLGMKDSIIQLFGLMRSGTANELVGLRGDAETLSIGIRQAVADEFRGLQIDVARISDQVQNAVSLNLGQLLTDASAKALAIRSAVANEFIGLRSDLTTITASAAAAVLNAFVGMRNNAVSLAASLVSGVLGQLATMPPAGFGIGQSLGLGIAAGIRTTIGTVAAEAASLVTNAIVAARTAADARSPSRMMMALGNDLTAGLSLGIASGQRRVSEALADLVAPPGIGALLAQGAGGGYGAAGGFANYGTLNVRNDDPGQWLNDIQAQKVTGVRK